jgi:hypothetical protein
MGAQCSPFGAVQVAARTKSRITAYASAGCRERRRAHVGEDLEPGCWLLFRLPTGAVLGRLRLSAAQRTSFAAIPDGNRTGSRIAARLRPRDSGSSSCRSSRRSPRRPHRLIRLDHLDIHFQPPTRSPLGDARGTGHACPQERRRHPKLTNETTEPLKTQRHRTARPRGARPRRAERPRGAAPTPTCVRRDR